jgi:K+-sensing histidine kinase KdpD
MLKAYTQYLQMVFKRKGDPQAVELLAKFDAHMNKLNKLITDLVDATIIQVGRLRLTLEDVEVNELVNEIVEEVQPTMPHHRLITELAASATIRADKLRLGQVLTNLLSNAMKYSPGADRIVVKTAVTNQAVTLCVHDFGMGIPQDKQGSTFCFTLPRTARNEHEQLAL